MITVWFTWACIIMWIRDSRHNNVHLEVVHVAAEEDLWQLERLKLVLRNKPYRMVC